MDRKTRKGSKSHLTNRFSARYHIIVPKSKQPNGFKLRTITFNRATVREGAGFTEPSTGYLCRVSKVTSDYVVWNYTGFHKEPDKVTYFKDGDRSKRYRPEYGF